MHAERCMQRVACRELHAESSVEETAGENCYPIERKRERER